VWVNAVAPAPVSTPAWVGPGGVADAIAHASDSTRETVVAQAAQLNSMTIGRMIAPEEVAALVLFLALDRAAAITGVEYLIDGGMVKDHLRRSDSADSLERYADGGLQAAMDQDLALVNVLDCAHPTRVRPTHLQARRQHREATVHRGCLPQHASIRGPSLARG
jgi:Enoyl-(Acyl carrier protein) reductase